MECIGSALCRERGLSGAVTGQRRGARSGAVAAKAVACTERAHVAMIWASE